LLRGHRGQVEDQRLRSLNFDSNSDSRADDAMQHALTRNELTDEKNEMEQYEKTLHKQHSLNNTPSKWHSGGRRFDPVRLHQIPIPSIYFMTS